MVALRVKTKTHFRKHITLVITYSWWWSSWWFILLFFFFSFILNYVLHSTGSMYDSQYGELIRERVSAASWGGSGSWLGFPWVSHSEGVSCLSSHDRLTSGQTQDTLKGLHLVWQRFSVSWRNSWTLRMWKKHLSRSLGACRHFGSNLIEMDSWLLSAHMLICSLVNALLSQIDMLITAH